VAGVRGVSASPRIRIELRGRDQLDSVRELWLELHHHHQRVAAFQPLLDDDVLSWERRRALYLERLDNDAGFLAVALDEVGSTVVGYAVVTIEAGPDDTFPLGERYAELFSLAVTEGRRGEAVGTRLLDFVDEQLAARGISGLKVGVMLGNADALRLYQRRGLRPAELVLYRTDAGAQGRERDAPDPANDKPAS
jgi:ribosomal protein S18 acetylase RimI-like enzyme